LARSRAITCWMPTTSRPGTRVAGRSAGATSSGWARPRRSGSARQTRPDRTAPGRVAESDRALPFFTIGHSTRQVVELAELLTDAEVGVLVDVRAIPRSRTNPQFNEDVLPAALAAAAIDYEHIAALGGRRGKKTGIPPAVNAFWTNQSFHNYADYAMGGEFRAALARLRARGR